MMDLQKFRIYLVSFSFIFAISFPVLNDQFNFIKDIRSSENRKLATKPSFNISKLDPFPAAYENYYNDTFCLRNKLIYGFGMYNYRFLKKSPYPEGVVIGKDGWLFFAGDDMDTYTGRNMLTELELKQFTEELVYRSTYLKERGCEFYFMIAPSKPCIYSEFVPFETRRITEMSHGEKLLEYISKNSQVKTISIYKTLKEHSTQHQLFFKFDNHWTGYGAFYGANVALAEMRKGFPGLKTYTLNDFKVKTKERRDGNTARFMGNLDCFTELDFEFKSVSPPKAKAAVEAGYSQKDFPYPSEYELAFEVDDTAKKRLLLISDSFGDFILPFFTEQFSKTVKIWDNWEFKLNPEIVEKEKPDVVLLLMSEKNLRLLLKHCSKPSAESKK